MEKLISVNSLSSLGIQSTATAKSLVHRRYSIRAHNVGAIVIHAKSFCLLLQQSLKATESHPRTRLFENPKSHPRQWVDSSGPAYTVGARPSRYYSFSFPRVCEEKNKTGTGGPAYRRSDLNNPHTAVGGIWDFSYSLRKWVDRSSPAYKAHTHGALS